MRVYQNPTELVKETKHRYGAKQLGTVVAILRFANKLIRHVRALSSSGRDIFDLFETLEDEETRV